MLTMRAVIATLPNLFSRRAKGSATLPVTGVVTFYSVGCQSETRPPRQQIRMLYPELDGKRSGTSV